MTRFRRALERAAAIESDLASELARVGGRHDGEPDIVHLCALMADEANTQARQLAALSGRSGVEGGDPPLLLDDLTTLYVRVQEAWIHAVVIRQAALATRDPEALAAADAWLEQAARQAKWLKTRIKTTAPQALTAE